MLKKCFHCLAEFKAKPSELGKFCSHECYWDSKRQNPVCNWKEDRICDGCKCSFKAVKSSIEKGMGRFCSKPCFGRYLTENGLRAGSNAFQWKGREHNCRCKRCGKTFWLGLGRINNGQKYCSKKCWRETLIPKIPMQCIECGKIKLIYYSHFARGVGECCSRRCARVKLFRQNKVATWTGDNRRSKAGKRADLNNLYVRSSWEANWARYLKFLVEHKKIIKWEYEPDTFEFKTIKRGTRFYTPDFKVFENDGSIVYHEVKGYNDEKSKTRAKRMKRFYPHIKIRLVDQAAYRGLERTVKGLILFWE